MEWHPVFDKFGGGGKTSIEKPSRSRSHTALQRHSTYDFGVWGNSSVSGLQQTRCPQASATFFRRTVAPHVVERCPRARSVAAFPGYDPSRDRNYFDKTPVSSPAHSQRSGSCFSPARTPSRPASKALHLDGPMAVAAPDGAQGPGSARTTSTIASSSRHRLD
mmetsp:Transcript_91828/g.230731  ORF Transcript_91828/g.230731 Transcript_91828/m.230731 type:complete len:163 (-) Transcript_91828:155-643(-)